MEEADFLKALGKHLRKIRKQKKVSLRELELRGDVSRHIISEIENGKRDIRVTTLKKIMQALSISEKEFWEDFKSGKSNSQEELLSDSIKKIVKLTPAHNDVILLRNLLQSISDQLIGDTSKEALSRYFLIQRMELYECLNQEGLTSQQEKQFLSIKKKLLVKLNDEHSKFST